MRTAVFLYPLLAWLLACSDPATGEGNPRPLPITGGTAAPIAGGAPGLATGGAGAAGGAAGGAGLAGGGVGAGMGGAAITGGSGGGDAPVIDAGTAPVAGGPADAAAADAAMADTGVTPVVDAGEPDSGTAASELCAPGAGSTTVNATIVVPAGQLFDGECKRYVAGPAVGDGSQSESQDPVFRLEDGARLINVVLGFPAADGIHAYGDVTLSNITWEDIGEDAFTIKAPGTVAIDLGAAYDGSDKVFQINAPSTFRVSNFRADNAGKFIRQNGGTTFRIDVFIDHCDISNMKETIFRTDSSSSTVTMTNTRYSHIGSSGDRIWYDVNPANITVSGNTQY